MRFASFLSGGFTTMAVINTPERKLAKRISVQCTEGFEDGRRKLFFYFEIHVKKDAKIQAKKDSKQNLLYARWHNS